MNANETTISAQELNSFLPYYLRSVPLNQAQTGHIDRGDFHIIGQKTHPDQIAYLTGARIAFAMFEDHEEEIRLRAAGKGIRSVSERLDYDSTAEVAEFVSMRQAAIGLLRDLAYSDFAESAAAVREAKLVKRQIQARTTGAPMGGDGITL